MNEPKNEPASAGPAAVPTEEAQRGSNRDATEKLGTNCGGSSPEVASPNGEALALPEGPEIATSGKLHIATLWLPGLEWLVRVVIPAFVASFFVGRNEDFAK